MQRIYWVGLYVTCGMIGACGDASSARETIGSEVSAGLTVTPRRINSAAELDTLLEESELPVVVEFWASWCGPCHKVAPEVEALAKTFAGKAIVAKVDTDALPELSDKYDVETLPTLVVFRDGREAKRINGAASAGKIAEDLAL